MNLPGMRFETLQIRRAFLLDTFSNSKERIMAREDVAAGKMKQLKGKANDVIGAIKGDTGRQIKGKIQKGIGKAEAKLGKADRSR
jgi:uncharacterized protein YjbJ (UPF0337 family)